jgi:hypothetical protein
MYYRRNNSIKARWFSFKWAGCTLQNVWRTRESLRKASLWILWKYILRSPKILANLRLMSTAWCTSPRSRGFVKISAIWSWELTYRAWITPLSCARLTNRSRMSMCFIFLCSSGLCAHRKAPWLSNKSGIGSCPLLWISLRSDLIHVASLAASLRCRQWGAFLFAAKPEDWSAAA